MPVSAKMRAIIFIFACAALNIWLAMVATWFCSDIGVDALALPRHAGAPFARGILVLQQREDVAADIRMRDDAQAARQLRAHDPARPRHQQVVERGLGGVALRHLGAGIVGQIGIVEQRAQQRGLDALDVHHQIGDRAAEEPVRDDDRRHRRERDLVDLDDIGLAVALEHLALAAGGDAIKRTAVAVWPS